MIALTSQPLSLGPPRSQGPLSSSLEREDPGNEVVSGSCHNIRDWEKANENKQAMECKRVIAWIIGCFKSMQDLILKPDQITNFGVLFPVSRKIFLERFRVKDFQGL